ncbi:MAG: hypothetical protein K2N89_03960 [Lachnospiraceae bacterium]|nr:hypothetical protein [Lachnospiraceae bacterium]
MKAKYVMRGFGLGVVITAVVMSAYTRSAVADARVNVLKEYGIGEEAKLVDSDGTDVNGDNDTQGNEDNNGLEVIPFDETTVPTVPETKPEEENATQTDINTVPNGEENVDIIPPGDVTDDGDAPEPGNVIVIEPSDDDEKDEENEPANTITIVIAKGDDSGTVARKLHSAGLVDNAAEFDAFLIQHGYDKRMNPGTKVIDVDASWQEIADKLSR